jgi:hypothetical protein
MVDVRNNKCISCKITRPSYNYFGENKALYCKNCKLDKMVDIKNKKCFNCNLKHPIFNYNDQNKALYCACCRIDEMKW